MKILLTSPITPISDSAYSHRSAQAEIYAQMIYDSFQPEPVEVIINYRNKIKDYSEFDLVYVYHGNDWGGTLNLFGGIGGLSDPEGLVALHKMHPTLVSSIAIPMPDYAGLLRKRLKPGQKFDSILDELPEHTESHLYSTTPVSFEGTSNLVIGDSHAICMYRPGWEVLSVPFKTLHGALTAQGSLRQLMTDNFAHPGHFENVEFYFGNIDIRHHLMRQPNPEAAAIDLAERYFAAVDGRFPSANSLAIYEPLPIENESRKLPKTGYYKGTPFYGTWAERNHIRNFFADSLEQLCKNSQVKFIRWTKYLENEKGELDFKHMEKPRSVHLARASYPHWRGLNQVPEAVTPSTSLENFFS